MKFNELDEVDLKLLLLNGGPIEVDNLEVIPFRIDEIIKNYGYINYMANLQWMTITIEDFIESIDDVETKTYLEEKREHLKTLDFYIRIGGTEVVANLMQALSMIFRTDDIHIVNDEVIVLDAIKHDLLIEDEDGVFFFDEDILAEMDEEELKIIHRDNFDDIVEVIKVQNYLQSPSKAKGTEENPADEEVRKLMEHMKKMREKVDQAKKKQQAQDQSENTDISDVISAVSAKSNSINKFNIWELTLYQLYDEYTRLEIIENYNFGVRAIVAGAEKVDLKHWSSRSN